VLDLANNKVAFYYTHSRERSLEMKTTLELLPNSFKAKILSIPEGECRRRLEALGLREGKIISKVSGMPFRGPITIQLDGRQIAIGHMVSSRIEVAPISKF